MKTLLMIFLYLLLVQSRSSSAFADISDQNCTFTGSTAQNPPFVPTTGTNKALIIFVQFSDDTFGSNPPPPPLPDDGSLSRMLRAVDFDRDGDLDLIGVASGSYATGVKTPKFSSMPIQFEFKPIYPNPAKIQVNIELQLPATVRDEVRIDIFDITGRSVHNWVFVNRETAIRLSWNTQGQSSSFLSEGVYFVQVQIGMVRAVQKLLVLR